MGKRALPIGLRLWAIVLLVLVGYIHLALFADVFRLRNLLGQLFLLNAVGAAIAIAGVAADWRWVGFGLGSVVSGGAALARLAMLNMPGFARLLIGAPPRRRIAPLHPLPHVAAEAHPPVPVAHALLPLGLPIATLTPVSIVVELLFVAFAIYIWLGFRAPVEAAGASTDGSSS